LRGILVAFSGDSKVQELMADALAQPDTLPAIRRLLLEVMARAELKAWPKSWGEQVEKCLGSKDAKEVSHAVGAAAASKLRRFDRPLQNIAADPDRPRAVRVAAAAAFAAGGGSVPRRIFELLASQVSEKSGPVERVTAARALAGAALNVGQRRQIAHLLTKADPLVLPVLADALEKGSDRETGLAMVAALARAPGLGNLSAARLDHILANYPKDVRAAAGPLRKRLRAKEEGQLRRLDELKKLVLTGGDPRKGRQVFRDPRALCITCHRVGAEGESIGPDLSRIGAARTRADLLEAIVLPSASFARGFEPYVITTVQGKLYTGIIARQTGDAVYLRTADRSEVRVARADIENLSPGKESIMPQGLDRVLTVEELRDLLAFLATLGGGKR
jgi:putative heme-binding domain-containing protein